MAFFCKGEVCLVSSPEDYTGCPQYIPFEVSQHGWWAEMKQKIFATTALGFIP
jgi:hypothetical protein